MDHRDVLLRLARAYADATQRSTARVATLCANDGKFFRRIEGGGSCTFPVFDRTVRWFSDNWPAGTRWPTDVARPKPTPKAA